MTATSTATLPKRINQGSTLQRGLQVFGFVCIAAYALWPIIFRSGLTASDYGERTDIAVLGLAALALNLLVGYTGTISLGHSAFFGMGAYTSAILVNLHGWSPEWTFPMAALVCFILGALVAIPALRLTGVYIALVTLALAQLFPALIRFFDEQTEGSNGIKSVRFEPPSWSGLNSGRVDQALWLYIVALFLLVVGYYVARNIVKSRMGRAMVAVRDNPTAAAVMGVNVAFVKTITFGTSAALAGVAGSAYVFRLGQATPDNLYFTILGSILFLVIMVIGGQASLLGPIVGALVYYRVDSYTRGLGTKTELPGVFQDFINGRPNLATVLFATLLIGLMYLAPFGIVGLAHRIARRVVQIVPKVPSSRNEAAVSEPESSATMPGTPLEASASTTSSPNQGGNP